MNLIIIEFKYLIKMSIKIHTRSLFLYSQMNYICFNFNIYLIIAQKINILIKKQDEKREKQIHRKYIKRRTKHF